MSGNGLVGLETCISNYILRKKSAHREGQTGVQACVYTHTYTQIRIKTTLFLFSQTDNYSYVYFGNEIGLLDRGLRQNNDFTKYDFQLLHNLFNHAFTSVKNTLYFHHVSNTLQLHVLLKLQRNE